MKRLITLLNVTRRHSRRARRLLVCGAALLCSLAGVAAENNQALDPLFRDRSLLDITLTGPFTTIDREREDDKEYEGGTLTYMDNGEPVTLDVKYEVRGNFRLRKDICNYAQLWVDLDKDKVAGTLFENQNRIKLVVQCKQGSRYARYVVREDQVYRLFNTLTDLSYRSRLANVTFQDTDRDRERTTYGVFIEHKDRLAARSGMENVDLTSIPYTELDPAQGNLVDMFMFMVANTDYSIISATEDECCHNAKLLKPAGETRYFPTPYDFDSSGYVDASYAVPAPQLRLRSVTQRLYRGICMPPDVLNATLAKYRASRDEIMAIAGDTTYLSEREAEDTVEYLEEFYAIINDPEEVDDEIIDDCRG